MCAKLIFYYEFDIKIKYGELLNVRTVHTVNAIRLFSLDIIMVWKLNVDFVCEF